ncbi:histidine--tRNA ligase [Candidatus Gottesmanbacteria bacterium]|nr:histidine--tRNA ligase [Candidatus Gottesmanbacteria bacterium]
MIKAQTLQGFRDFLPDEKRKRDWLVKKIIDAFERYGFEPLETPTLEYASVILGKYGDEADKLVYKFKDRGDRDIALRYDQTVPTARILAQYSQQLLKYFRRYQIQNVFRADKPQKGRYREFTQCDIDIFGSTDPISDAEVIACTYFAYKNIGYPKIRLELNDRSILFDKLQKFSTDQVTILSIIQSIDKLDKMSEDQVLNELTKKGLTQANGKHALDTIKQATLSPNLTSIIELAQSLGVPKESLVFTPTLARGLDYYTGMIFEVKLSQYGHHSLGGGGRYDNLIKQLGGIDTPAVGIAFGFDRMVEVAEDLQLITTENLTTTILVTVFDKSLAQRSASIAQSMRSSGISTELYVSSADKLEKQLKYADKKGIPYVIIAGPEEIKKNVVQLKNMKEKTQEEVPIDAVIKKMM